MDVSTISYKTGRFHREISLFIEDILVFYVDFFKVLKDYFPVADFICFCLHCKICVYCFKLNVSPLSP